MGFSSLDDLINEMSNGKLLRTDWNKLALPTTTQVAGMWYDLACGAGNPGSDTDYGSGGAHTNKAFVALDDTSTTSPGIQHGGNVDPDTKHILNASAFSAAATSVPCTLMLIDRLGFYPITTTTTTGDQALDNTVVFPTGRHTNGKGLRAYVVTSSGAATTAMGAGTPNLRMTYTNQDGTAGKITPNVLPAGLTANPKGAIPYSGTGAGKYGPFMPLAAGDSGIRSVEQFNLSATYTSGNLNLVICRPLLTLPLTTIGVAAERDLLNQIPSLPRVYDGANLSWLMYAGVNTPVNSAYFGHLDFAWG
jgi:hypothetical protein